MFSQKATKFDKIFTINLTLCSNYQIDGEDFVAPLENMNFKPWLLLKTGHQTHTHKNQQCKSRAILGETTFAESRF